MNENIRLLTELVKYINTQTDDSIKKSIRVYINKSMLNAIQAGLICLKNDKKIYQQTNKPKEPQHINVPCPTCYSYNTYKIHKSEIYEYSYMCQSCFVGFN